jgi:1-acyl-sn-glycerol-3-phosphate acyltransferase
VETDLAATPDVIELAGRPVQLQGSVLATRALALLGWQVRFHGLPARQGVVIVYPHTSNWDFPLGILAKWALGFPVRFWGKDSLFRIPLFGHWLRWVGGVPVDRSSAHGVVEQMAQRMKQARDRKEFFWLALAPEGTRSYREHWRSGFYRVATQAKLPLGMAYFDFEHKVVSLERFIHLSGDAPADMAAIAKYLGHRRGKKPELAGPIRLPPAREAAR